MDELRSFFRLLRRAFASCYCDGGFGTAKAAAYSALLSFIPVLTAIATILVQVRADQVSRMISEFLFVAVPPGTEEMVRYSFSVKGQRPISVLVTATLVSLWAAGGLTASLMEGFQAAYHQKSGRHWIRQRVVAILLVLVAAAPVVCASTLIVVGDRVETTILAALGFISSGTQVRGGIVLAGYVVRYFLALGAIVLAAALMYYFGPDRKQNWEHVFPGAMVATALWLVSTIGFAWYVRNIANYNVMYGSIGAVIALLVWMYVLAVIALVGCEFNAERERYLAGQATEGDAADPLLGT